MKSVLPAFTVVFFLFTFFKCENRTRAAGPLAGDECFDMNWAKHSLWDDGLAEVAIYDAEKIIYGKTRKFEYVHICVKEEFNQAYRVKTDDYQRQDLYTVLKVNKFCRIMTDNYPYHFMTSLFLKRENPLKLHKLTTSSQEWCGTTFQMAMESQKGFHYSYNSYWDGQGVGEKAVQDESVWWEDQLSYSLRALKFEEGLEFNKTVLPSLVSNKAASLKPLQTRFSVHQENGLWKVTARFEGGKVAEFWFRPEYPNLLEKYLCTDGNKLRLKTAQRKAYWN